MLVVKFQSIMNLFIYKMHFFRLMKSKFQINYMLRKSNVAYAGTCKRKMD